MSVENKKKSDNHFHTQVLSNFNFVLNSILDQRVGVSKKLPPKTLKLGVSSTYLVADCLKMRFHIFFSVQTLGFGLSFVEISSEHTSYCSTISLTDSL